MEGLGPRQVFFFFEVTLLIDSLFAWPIGSWRLFLDFWMSQVKRSPEAQTHTTDFLPFSKQAAKSARNSITSMQITEDHPTSTSK